MKSVDLSETIGPVVDGLGFELWGYEYFPQGKQTILRVYIERAQGVSLMDCQQVSEQLSAVLDVVDPIHGRYILEVSSPGIQRRLFNRTHYMRYLGYQILVRMRRSINDRHNFKGLLKSVDDDSLTIEVDGQQFILPIIDIEKANLLG